jgi:hypothetical protein
VTAFVQLLGVALNLLHEFPELEEVGAQGIGELPKRRRGGYELPRRKIRERASAV